MHKKVCDRFWAFSPYSTDDGQQRFADLTSSDMPQGDEQRSNKSSPLSPPAKEPLFIGGAEDDSFSEPPSTQRPRASRVPATQEESYDDVDPDYFRQVIDAQKSKVARVVDEGDDDEWMPSQSQSKVKSQSSQAVKRQTTAPRTKATGGKAQTARRKTVAQK